MTYSDGIEVQVGDRILLDGEPSIVEYIIDTEVKAAEYGLVEIGIMVTNESIGRVFQPVNSVDWDAVDFVSRRPAR